MTNLVWYDRHLVGFENRLKDEDRIKDKIAESLAVKGRTVAEAMKLIPDAIRYSFCYHEADYSGHLLEDIVLTQQRSSGLVRLRNFWGADRYKGISSLWRHYDTGQLFEMQFHTEISYHAMQLTHGAHARLRSAQTCAQEQIELETFQREVYAHVPVPSGAPDIPGHPVHLGPGIPGWGSTHGADVTYYAIVDDLSSLDGPAGVLRRRWRDGGKRDEAFTRDLAWHRSSLLISAEHGDLENEFVEITADEAGRIVDRIRQSVTGRPETTAVSAQGPAETSSDPTRMVDIGPVCDIDDRDHPLVIIDTIPDPVVPAARRPVALERRHQRLPNAPRIVAKGAGDEFPCGEGNRRGERLRERATRLGLDD